MMQACIKAAGSGVPDVLVEPASISQFIWDVAEDLFLKLNNRRYGASPSASKPASAEMTKEESKTYLEDPPQDPPDPPQEEDDDEVPF